MQKIKLKARLYNSLKLQMGMTDIHQDCSKDLRIFAFKLVKVVMTLGDFPFAELSTVENNLTYVSSALTRV